MNIKYEQQNVIRASSVKSDDIFSQMEFSMRLHPRSYAKSNWEKKYYHFKLGEPLMKQSEIFF